MSCSVKLLSNIKANCASSGGLSTDIYIGSLPVQPDFAKDGSIYGFKLGSCQRLIKATTRPEKNNLEEAISDSDNGAIFEPTLTVVFQPNGDPVQIARIENLVKSENLFAIVETQSGSFIAVGLSGGLRVNGGSKTTGTIKTDPNNFTITLFGQSSGVGKIFKHGSVAQTREYLDSLTQFKGNYVVTKTANGLITFVQQTADIFSIGNKVWAVLNQSKGFAFSSNRGKSWSVLGSAELVSADAVSENVIFGITNTQLLKSTNGGLSFAEIQTLSSGFVAQNLKIYKDKIYIAGTNNNIYQVKVYDFIGNLVSSSSLFGFGAFCLLEVGCDVVLVTGWTGTYKASVKDLNFNLIYEESPDGMIKIISENVYLLRPAPNLISTLIRTEDGGETWEEVMNQRVYTLAVFDCKTILAITANGNNTRIRLSFDGGKTWNLQNSFLAGVEINVAEWIDEITIAWVGNNSSNVIAGQILLDCGSTNC